MGGSIAVEPKRRGRPATGRDPLVGVRLPDSLIAKLDDWAKGGEMSRSEAIRRLIELGLQHPTRSAEPVADSPATAMPEPGDNLPEPRLHRTRS